MNTVLRYGLAGGATISVLLFAPFFIFGARPEWMKVGEIVGYASMLLCLSATWFAMRREAQRRGGLGYGAALAIGVGVAAVAGLLFGLATWLFYSAVGDALPEALIAFYAEQIRQSGAAPAAVATQLRELEAMRPFFFDRPLQGGIMAATVFVLGVLESVVGAFFVARPGPAPAAA
ncbi:DUF4199 domain-containing protein [Tahibacter caeni]|uniref:DUF4199 domain-containing protein n=1 Tax=Tahibacter caeni TaxID=1453545 RepID=UPI002148CB06|nr:DUF4199 domain-containing protein [Tahibacter caeni]